MNADILSNEHLERLANQVDQELQELSAALPPGRQKGGAGGAGSTVPAKQRAVIERETGESADSFWQKYRQAARKDLCHEDGYLYKQWHQWRDLASKDAVKMSLGFVAGLGIGGTALPTVAVAASVILLNIVVNVGVKAICEDDPGAGS